ncbi:Na+/H+ antiporter MnhB subunit-related protein [Alkaliphilus metalliredigens QYMF]|uniref:Na+/H+ antiporter MnhB subunit-related protein n=1 Tax=Alkaliphilus metalliredigens (strain QYMF) TaxID=293826 RepID=A6TVL7_ALKMQ|nr:MnhB domain-containing protein [Alkaliphilus metalliredigens]ABR50235.1 Na+/H+ antiporter MnhB subunit-related protein [Alkaliphilus metalliredigens QYMF]
MDDLIVKTITRIVMPFIQLYGVFIVLHGHISPGGGFAGGAIIGASLVLYTLAFGLKKGHQKMPHRISSRIESGGILWLISLGLIGVIMGGNFLENQSAGFHMGQLGTVISAGLIPLATVGIGMKVGSTMITLFHTMIEEE